MGIRDCPGCGHPRDSHDGGSCFHLIEAVTAGGEAHLTMCGFCSWEPFLNENGTRAWRNNLGQAPAITVEGVAEAAIREAERIMGLR